MSVVSEQTLQAIIKGVTSKFPIFYIVSWEEERVEHALTRISGAYYKDSRPLINWTEFRGFYSKNISEPSLNEPIKALQFIAQNSENAFYLLKDLPARFQDTPSLIRALRDLYISLQNKDTFVFISYPSLILPEQLKKELYVLELNLPQAQEINQYLKQLSDRRKLTEKVDTDWLLSCSRAMRGLTLNEVKHLYNRIINSKKINKISVIDDINEEKAQVLMKESCLKLYPHNLDMDKIGGLENLKEWVENRKNLFVDFIDDEEIPRPSGVLMMGVSGCGKSLATKIIAAAWSLQLVRLDMNLVLSGAFGPPEYAFDRALKVVENIAPVLLWIDEIENSFGYDEGPLSGGNVNIFSSFLTWMQEKPSTVFVAATANRIQMLPAEMLRKGRFDQVFFLDLPNEAERIEIFKIHIQNYGADTEAFDMQLLSAATKDWNGAEIEQAVKSARIDAAHEKREFTARDITRNTAKMVPLSTTMHEQVKALRDWSFQRATPASKGSRQ